MNLLIKYIGIAFISCCNFFHPVHVLIINMEYLHEKNEISISFKIDKHDFQLLFAHLHQVNIDFNKEGDYAKYVTRIDEYFSGHFKVSEGGVEFKLFNKEIKLDEDSVWFYYRISLNNALKTVKVQNTMLLDLYLDQKSLMIFRHNNTEKGYQFDLSKKEYIINLDDY